MYIHPPIPPELRFKFGDSNGSKDKYIAMFWVTEDNVQHGNSIKYTDDELRKLAKTIEDYANMEIGTWPS